MKLVERLARRSGRGLHTAFATSFAVEFAAFEQIMLPQLMASGANNILLIADERMSALGLSDGSTLPTCLGRDYALYGPPATSGVFHPKIVLQLGRDRGRAFVSSANVTAAGLGGNVEIATEIECSEEPSAEQAFVRTVWRYLERITRGAEGAAHDSIVWATERTPWLAGPSTDALLTLGDTSHLAFLSVPAEEGLLERIARFVDAAPVERVVIVSPYWDDQLDTISELQSLLSPQRITVLLDAQRHDFPRKATLAADLEIIDISTWRGSRFTHAKLILAQTAEHDHVLSGSANCTSAALGRAGYVGVNAEACVYRRLPSGAVVEALGLAEFLARSPTPASQLPDIKHRKPIPLESIGDRRPGRFEVDRGALFWIPPVAPDWTGGSIRLLNLDGSAAIVIGADKLVAQERRKVVPYDTAQLAEIHFAQVILGEDISTIAPVTHRDLMKNRRREPLSGRTARSATLFIDGSDLQLFYLEAYEDLYRADSVQDMAASNISASRVSSRREEAEPKPARKLTYEEFMSERAMRPTNVERGANALAGTNCNAARALLNRLSGGLGEDPNTRPPDDSWMDLGDEPEGQNNNNRDIPEPKPKGPQIVKERDADGNAFERAVKTYTGGLAKNQRPLGPADVVKLRLLLMTILWNARSETFPGGLACSIDDQGWPRLATRVISAFFWGRNSPVRRLILEGEFEQIPIDFLESWATVLWTLDVISQALPASVLHRDFLRKISILRAGVASQLGLTQADLAGEVMRKCRIGLDRGLGRRLGLASNGEANASVAAASERLHRRSVAHGSPSAR